MKQLRTWIFWLLGAFVVWFIPWVFVLYLGVLVYFPYHADGVTRYVRITGPAVGWLSDQWTPYEQIPRSCREALIAAEDATYFEHRGVDFDSLQRAHARNERRGKIRAGGSTITQQLVKNAFLSRTRSYVRKARELMGALLLDVIMSKEKQLAWYFNIVEFGPDTYGIAAASQRYFRKPTSKLTRSQCINLVSILPYPTRYFGTLMGAKTPKFLEMKRDRIGRVIN